MLFGAKGQFCLCIVRLTHSGRSHAVKGTTSKNEGVLPICKDCALDENYLAGDLADLQPAHEARKENENGDPRDGRSLEGLAT